MTLLNHIGIFVLIFLALFFVVIFSSDMRAKYLYTASRIYLLLSTMFLWSIFEAFYWTLKIFF